MELITILNRCHRFRGFVYQHAHFSADNKSIEVAVRARKSSAAVCSRCHLPALGYDQLAERRFEFVPLWGFLVFLPYTMRRVNCHRCDIVAVEEVPWGDGKRTLTKAYMLFFARWARRLSWKETAEAFRTSWDKVFDAVEHVVTFGLAPNRIRPAMARVIRFPEKWRAKLSPKSFHPPPWSRPPANRRAQAVSGSNPRLCRGQRKSLRRTVACDDRRHQPRSLKKRRSPRRCRSAWSKRFKNFWAQTPLRASISRRWKRPCAIELCNSRRNDRLICRTCESVQPGIRAAGRPFG
jgi:hypothetical protein